MISLTLLILLLCATALCFVCNRDIFSPAKFYHVSLAVYFVDVFLSEQSGYIYGIYLAFILTGMVMSILEAYTLSVWRIGRVRPEPFGMLPSHFVITLWILSLIPVLSQGYLIHVTGGLSSLARTIAYRVTEWRGLGAVLVLIQLMCPINLAYFAVGLIYVKKHPLLFWCLYVVHLVLFFGIAMLLGGRSFVLVQVLLLMVIYNYLRRPVKLRYAIATGATLLVFAAFLGAVRNNLTRIENLDSLAHMSGDTLNLKMFSYGVNPLNVVFEGQFADYQYGKTFLTPVTNFVPRKIWPDKFEPGGVVLTKFWQGNRYTGLSHMSTGIVTESILNFGYPLGIFGGFVVLVVTAFVSLRFYRYILSHVCESKGLTRVYIVILYVTVGQIPGGLLYGEFQNNIGGLLIRVVQLLVVVAALRLHFFPSQTVVKASMRTC